MAEVVNWEKCIDLASKRLRDVITAANKADSNKMESLMMSSLCDNINDFVEIADTVQTELTLNGDQTNGIYFTFQSYKFHITKDSEYNSKYHSDLYHIWCECTYFDGEEVPMSHVYVNWLCGGDFMEYKHQAFLAGEISEKKFADYIYEDVRFCLRDWLKNKKDKIDKIKQ